jgi:hypothetical protein
VAEEVEELLAVRLVLGVQEITPQLHHHKVAMEGRVLLLHLWVLVAVAVLLLLGQMEKILVLVQEAMELRQHFLVHP